MQTIEVLEGSMGVLIDGKVHRLEAGAKIPIPRGARHTFWSASDSADLTVRINMSDCSPRPGCVRAK